MLLSKPGDPPGDLRPLGGIAHADGWILHVCDEERKSSTCPERGSIAIVSVVCVVAGPFRPGAGSVSWVIGQIFGTVTPRKICKQPQHFEAWVPMCVGYCGSTVSISENHHSAIPRTITQHSSGNPNPQGITTCNPSGGSVSPRKGTAGFPTQHLRLPFLRGD